VKAPPSVIAAASKRALGTPSGNSITARSRIFSVTSFQTADMFLVVDDVVNWIVCGNWRFSSDRRRGIEIPGRWFKYMRDEPAVGNRKGKEKSRHNSKLKMLGSEVRLRIHGRKAVQKSKFSPSGTLARFGPSAFSCSRIQDRKSHWSLLGKCDAFHVHPQDLSHHQVLVVVTWLVGWPYHRTYSVILE